MRSDGSRGSTIAATPCPRRSRPSRRVATICAISAGRLARALRGMRIAPWTARGWSRRVRRCASTYPPDDVCGWRLESGRREGRLLPGGSGSPTAPRIGPDARRHDSGQAVDSVKGRLRSRGRGTRATGRAGLRYDVRLAKAGVAMAGFRMPHARTCSPTRSVVPSHARTGPWRTGQRWTSIQVRAGRGASVRARHATLARRRSRARERAPP